jgi:hypothetical protein
MIEQMNAANEAWQEYRDQHGLSADGPNYNAVRYAFMIGFAFGFLDGMTPDPECDCRDGIVTPPPPSSSSPIHINTITPPPPLNEQAARIRALNQNEGAD